MTKFPQNRQTGLRPALGRFGVFLNFAFDSEYDLEINDNCMRVLFDPMSFNFTERILI